MNKNLLYVIIFSFLITACAAHKQMEMQKVFYPTPPDLARIQFLTTLTGEKDFVQKRSAFESFVTGVAESQRRVDKPYGVAIWNGRIYVCDVNQGLIVLDLEKKTERRVSAGTGHAQYCRAAHGCPHCEIQRR